MCCVRNKFQAAGNWNLTEIACFVGSGYLGRINESPQSHNYFHWGIPSQCCTPHSKPQGEHKSTWYSFYHFHPFFHIDLLPFYIFSFPGFTLRCSFQDNDARIVFTASPQEKMMDFFCKVRSYHLENAPMSSHIQDLPLYLPLLKSQHPWWTHQGDSAFIISAFGPSFSVHPTDSSKEWPCLGHGLMSKWIKYLQAFEMNFYGPHIQFFLPLWYSDDWWQMVDCVPENFLKVIDHAIYLGKWAGKADNAKTLGSYWPKNAHSIS